MVCQNRAASLIWLNGWRRRAGVNERTCQRAQSFAEDIAYLVRGPACRALPSGDAERLRGCGIVLAQHSPLDKHGTLCGRQVLEPTAKLATTLTLKKLAKLRGRDTRRRQVIVIDAQSVSTAGFDRGKGAGLTLTELANGCLNELVAQYELRFAAIGARINLSTSHGLFNQADSLTFISEQKGSGLKELGSCVLYEHLATTLFSHRVSSNAYIYPH